MFKRLSKAAALRDEFGDDETLGPVTLDTVIDENSGSEEEDEEDDDDSDEQDDDEEDEGEDDVEGDADDNEEDEAGELTVASALKSPIYVDPDTKATVFRCIACPIVTLKNDKSIDVHLESKVRPCRRRTRLTIQGHKRRHARFVSFVHSEAEKEGDRTFEADPRTLVDVLEDERAREQQTAAQENEGSRKVCGRALLALLTAQRQRAEKEEQGPHVPRKERRKQRREERRKRRAAERGEIKPAEQGNKAAHEAPQTKRRKVPKNQATGA